MDELFKSPVQIEYLHIDGFYMKCCPDKYLPPNLDDLKVIRLSAISFDDVDYVLLALFYIRRCHELRKVTFDAVLGTGIVSKQVEKFYYKSLSRLKWDTAFGQIREVEMQFISGTWSELEFIKFLLAKVLMLENLVIIPNIHALKDGGLRLLKEVAGLNVPQVTQKLYSKTETTTTGVAPFFWLLAIEKAELVQILSSTRQAYQRNRI